MISVLPAGVAALEVVAMDETTTGEVTAVRVVSLDLGVDDVERMGSWLSAGHDAPRPHGLIEQQPMNLFVAQEYQRKPVGHALPS